jgi:hypothetical protein
MLRRRKQTPSRGIVVRVPGYTSEMYCDSCGVRTEFICYVDESSPPLWSGGQSSWLKVRDRFPALPNTREVVGLERGPLSLGSTIEDLLGRNVAAPV